jgi:hypothetical protein
VTTDPIPRTELVPGKWYVSFFSLHPPEPPPVAGPYDTEEQARDFLRCVVLPRGGVVWQCQPGSRHPDRR